MTSDDLFTLAVDSLDVEVVADRPIKEDEDDDEEDEDKEAAVRGAVGVDTVLSNESLPTDHLKCT